MPRSVHQYIRAELGHVARDTIDYNMRKTQFNYNSL